MNYQVNLDEYKQQIVDLYSRRSPNYDESEWHTHITHYLVESAQINPGHHILDIATGTGHVAIKAAQIVGSSGRVVGVDISPDMLNKARQKVAKFKFNNVEFLLVDAEKLDFPVNSFDCVFCANAFPWMADKEAALRLWHRLLKPGGLIAIHSPADTTYVVNMILQDVLEKYGVIVVASSKPTGTVEKFHDILAKTGFAVIEIKTEEYEGNYIRLEQAQQKLNVSYYPELANFSADKIATIKADFEAKLAELATADGIWNDGIALFAYGRKLVDSSS